ncbi:MAG: hypothetical protein AAF646_03765 [Pseudomonadota bacterium]
MGVEDELGALRAAFPGCSIIAFADLEARIVLVSSSASTARRDTLDGMCSSAVAMFAAAERAGEHAADTVLRSQNGSLEVALRDPVRRDDALCAICAPETDLDGYLLRARAVLDALAQEGGV